MGSHLNKKIKRARDIWNASSLDALVLLGRMHAERICALGRVRSLEEAEFKVFSQAGEDGIIQYLMQRIDVPVKAFVEFGVGDYRESNTRFLLINNNWTGLIMDGSKAEIDSIRQDDISWRHDLRSVQAFITRDNINALIADNLGRGDIGLLSVDIDGMDYWVLEAIDVISPRILICEFHAIFGVERALAVPYSASFARHEAHYSGQYFGASLKAFCLLAACKGYDFVGTNSKGSNAFFVRKDLSSPFRVVSAAEGFRPVTYRDARSPSGHLAFTHPQQAVRAMSGLEVVDVEQGKTIKIAEILPEIERLYPLRIGERII